MKLELKGFKTAQKNIAPYVSSTPLIKNEWLSKKYNCNMYLKLESLQPVGSFKLRGATNFMSHMTEEEKKMGVLAVSAGNHAQGVAWAAEKFGIEATIIMPTSSPLTKIANTEAMGAKVILNGENVDESFEFAKEYLKKNKKVFIHPFNHENVIYGQGTIAYELKDQMPEIDYLFGSIGGGGLMAGIGMVVKDIFEKCTIVGCQSTGAASMIKSLQQGKLMESETVATFADGIKVKKPLLNMYELLDKIIDEAVHVSDDKVAKSLLDLIENARIITEGAGAINLAAFDELYERNPRRFKDKNIVLIICGGNIDINLVDRIIDMGLMESKRRVKMKVIIEDKPGALHILTGILSEVNANVLQIYHLRDEGGIQLNQSIAEVIMETKGEDHMEEVFEAVKKQFDIIPWATMADIDILRKIPDLNYREPAPEINANEFQKVIDSRRSVRVFSDEKVPEDIMRRCIENALLAPNSSNLQPWEFYWVRSEEKKKELANICMGQSAATTAQELVVCVARTDQWKTVQKQMIQYFDDSEEDVPKGAYLYYQKIVSLAYNQGPLNLFGFFKKILFSLQGVTKVTPREPTSYADMRVWAHKSTALACENLMLSLRAYGYDSCPMEGHDSKRVKQLLGLSRKAEICMVISAGKRADNGIFSERVRMPLEQFVKEV